jgi:hypothetical protein
MRPRPVRTEARTRAGPPLNRLEGWVSKTFVLRRPSGLTSGVANRFGGSYEAVNYYEALSDAFAQAVGTLANSRSFQKAIAHR